MSTQVQIKKAMENLNSSMRRQDQPFTIPFEEFLQVLSEKPQIVIRNVFQVFHDMVKTYVGEGIDEYSDDPESIHYAYYDCSKLFVAHSEHPFFADRLFANRLINHVESLRRGAQQNNIYIFEGPPGCGKSTFLNNLLKKFEEYSNTADGRRFETVWIIDRRMFDTFGQEEINPMLVKLLELFDINSENGKDTIHSINQSLNEPYIEIPCPSHDNPILMIPKHMRRAFFDDLFKNDKFKWKLFTEKEYEWVFKDSPCTICSSLYQALLYKLRSHQKVFHLLYARPYQFNRRLGEGISVFNPGDAPMKQRVFENQILQRRINSLFKDSNQVNYIFSKFAKTNNGIYALMDIKSHNTERLIELHNIISEGVHKVEDIEENVNSLFIALMNPEDKKNIQNFQSFTDRIEYINLPYVLDLNTEVEIYRSIFGKHIEESFLPRVLHNFARIIISSRMNLKSEALLEWIGDPDRYSLYCDVNLQLLKMEIYTGYIPKWLREEDRNRFTAKRRRRIIGESETEGRHGFSGRDSIKIFNEFFSTYAREDKLINMNMLVKYFTKVRKDLYASIPQGFLDSLCRMYDYTILQEVKESLYYYNEDQIARDIMHYIFVVNFEVGTTEKCTFTGEKIEITEEYIQNIESRLLGADADYDKRLRFRRNTQREYTSQTLPQEMLLEDLHITKTHLFHSLRERYIYNLKEKVLDPFLENENFRRAIKDFEDEDFKTYDKRIRADVTYLINNLCEKYRYTKQGAKEVCMYVIDNNLATKYAES
ncbi:serine protein kinase PrkA [candidate division KSB1 bacterium]|nr:serine protein kinase PrkA [candidate division KSB1 bacterium]